jgi:hypothetical protein
VVLGYHVPLANYGFWLPNDERGSGSDYVRKKSLLQFGAAKTLTTRRSTARAPHNFELRRLAKELLRYPAVEFNEQQIQSVARGFAKVARDNGIVIHACAILSGHQHLVIKRHRLLIEQLIRQLRTGASRQLLEDRLHPFAHVREPDGSIPRIWGRSPWKVFLNSDAEILDAIDYVEDNPLKDDKPRQNWHFITPFPRPAPPDVNVEWPDDLNLSIE